jgi:hypothetical protein
MEAVVEQSAKAHEPPIRAFEGNRIRYVIEAQVDLTRNEGLREEFRTRICQALGITKRYTQMLNNIVQPSLEDATTIAQILGVTVDDLCILATEAKK